MKRCRSLDLCLQAGGVCETWVNDDSHVTYYDSHSLRHVSSTYAQATASPSRLFKLIRCCWKGALFSHTLIILSHHSSLMDLKPWFLNGQSCGSHYIFMSESFNHYNGRQRRKIYVKVTLTMTLGSLVPQAFTWTPQRMEWIASHHSARKPPTPGQCLARLGPSRPHRKA